MPKGYFVFTSNVDGQFQKAGFDSRRIFECHGSIHTLQCLLPCHESVWTADHLHPQVDETACELTSPLPRCPQCGGLARPNILMFNDDAWDGQVYDRQQERLEQWLTQVTLLVVIEIGAGHPSSTVKRVSH